MGRKVFLNDNDFVLKMTGITWLFAFRRTVTIPYKVMSDVTVETFKTPPGMIRTLGTSVPPSFQQGNYLYNGELYFLSHEHHVPLLHIEINGHKPYRHVIFELDSGYRDLLIDLRKKIREAQKRGFIIF
ncbi:MAG TPA: hypothetical protein VFK33_14645 [Bacillales bacterium]|nr:hypothetical protein [Bacillales bacterium]